MAALSNSTTAPVFDGQIVGFFASAKRDAEPVVYVQMTSLADELAAIREMAPNVATLVHGAINDMLRRSAPALRVEG